MARTRSTRTSLPRKTIAGRPGFAALVLNFQPGKLIRNDSCQSRRMKLSSVRHMPMNAFRSPVGQRDVCDV